MKKYDFNDGFSGWAATQKKFVFEFYEEWKKSEAKGAGLRWNSCWPRPQRYCLIVHYRIC